MRATPPSYSVREAAAADLLAVVRLIDGSPTLPPEQLSERQRAAWARAMATEGLTIYVAEADGEVIGTTSMLLMSHVTYECHPTAFIEAMTVADDHRRRGVGRLLIERALADARGASCRKIQLLSHKRHADDGAHDFYRSLGFEPEAEGFRLYIESPGSPTSNTRS